MQTVYSWYKLSYPPCTVEEFLKFPLERPRKRQILSIGQFRPEKNHKLQLTTLRKVIDSNPSKYGDVVLVMFCLNVKAIAGSCRAEDDEKRLEKLKELSQALKLDKNVKFCKNLPWKDLCKELEESMIGFHTMKDEHFGIVLVELIAAGLVTIAHKSAGPKYDIIQEDVKNPKGFLADNEEDFVTHLKYALDNFEGLKKLRENARAHAKTFSDEVFVEEFLKIFESFITRYYKTKKKTT
jgi:alpha-1,2-mannosyltransferase